MILGTAGHIDHGKTSLIRAVTGTNTDRLKEEQLRGITIELGFAALDLPGGRHLGIVDVPGHEKFVKNMVAGATGIDMVAMVIAADEGVMPQTVEHMEICALLGVEHGLVVLTKIDMVDEEWLELVTEDVRDFTAGTFLEDRPILPVSSATGDGIPEFLAALEALSKEVPERSPINIFRLPVDRVFTMKGFGTVITGTLVSGRVGVGETVMLYPSGITAKVRGLQVHNESVETAGGGMRTAINFQGLEKADVERGEVVSTPGALVSSYMVDVHLRYLSSNKRPLKSRTRVRFHTGTSEILGIVVLIDREELSPGEDAVVQMRLDAPVALVRDDRFVIRSYSPVRTVGGGRILNPIPKKHKRFRAEVIEELADLTADAPEEIVAHHVLRAGYAGRSFAELKIMCNLSDKPLESALQGLLTRREVILVDKEQRVFIHGDAFEALQDEAIGHMTVHHSRFPLKAGMPKEELKSKFRPDLRPKVFNQALNQMIREERVVQEEKTIRLPEHEVSLGEDQADIREKILDTYRKNGLTPPYFKDLPGTFKVDPARAKEVLHFLVEEGQLVKVKEELFFHADAIAGLRERLVAFFGENDALTPADFKEMTGLSRKYLIPLLEHFDARNITIRVGDVRKLRKG